ncbi:hypothetical protein KSZ28_21575 [Bacteroides salyersiae]|uniref:hypothetical protein n=1 Tax=Bacteroides salyersiae TaxID=291644 RepID=UPI001C384C37|nr:hypothetical protein [Bacteroides salyersiae]MBV4206293.1 hypothetical protein [Bacteroides salyersiae]MCB6651588.1 hypothetical protein [Bacteroides salyersiae]
MNRIYNDSRHKNQVVPCRPIGETVYPLWKYCNAIKILTHTSTPTSDLIFLLTKITSGVTSSRNTLNPDIAYTVVKQERVYNCFHFIEIKHDAGMIGYIKNKK